MDNYQGIDREIYEYIKKAEISVKDRFEDIDKIAGV